MYYCKRILLSQTVNTFMATNREEYRHGFVQKRDDKQEIEIEYVVGKLPSLERLQTYYILAHNI